MSFLALAVTVIATVPAHASTITNMFYGTVIATDEFGDYTTTDLGRLFSSRTSTILLGDTFTLRTGINTSNYGQMIDGDPFNINGSNDRSGYYYNNCASGKCNPISFSLSVDHLAKTVTDTTMTDDSGSAVFYDNAYGSLGSIGIRDMQGINSLNLSLNAVVPLPNGNGALLPAMQLSNGDFANQYSFFSGANGEKVVLQISSINALPSSPTPEPSSLVLLGTGLLGFGVVLRRKLCA